MSTTLSASTSVNTVVVTAVSTLSAPVYYFWYLDGVYQGVSMSGRWTFLLEFGEQAVVDCIDSNSSALPATPPAGYPATRTIEWVRSIGDVSRYQVQQQENGGSWVTIATVADSPSMWNYSIQTGMLDDLSTYAWQVIPLDAGGNAGTALALGSELIVRIPDAPDFTYTFNNSTQKITFAAA